jgi:hypothetical protein
MRWNRTTVQPFLEVRAGALNDTLEDAFRGRYPGFRPTDDDGQSQKGQPPGLHAFLMSVPGAGAKMHCACAKWPQASPCQT